MDFADVLAARRSCRSFRGDPISHEVLDAVLAAAARVPTAGNTWPFDLVVLDQPADVAGYWDVTLPAGATREAFPWPGLLRAPVLVLPVVDPGAYVRRYAEPDKQRTGLGAGEDAWPVPYWWVDAGGAITAMLFAATAHGLGSLLFGLFGHEAAVRDHLGIPDDRRVVGAIALGYADGDDRRSQSGKRARPEPANFTRHGGW